MSSSRMTVIGIGVGFAGAYGLANVIASLLHGVEPSDPTTFAGVSVLLLAIAAVAGYLPARRASRIAPVRALTI